MNSSPKLVFTFSPGRCATASIAGCFNQVKKEGDNIFHEFLQPDLVGEMTPGTNNLVDYNCRGYKNKGVKDFWNRKLINMSNLGAFQEGALYVETSHLLGKAGLIETILENLSSMSWISLKPEIFLIFPVRSPADLIASMYVRGDFLSIENRRVWYLEPQYQRNLLMFDSPNLPFTEDEGDIRLNYIAWYYWEMRVRQTMWINLLIELFHPQIRIYEIRVDNKEELNKEMEEIIGDIRREEIILEKVLINETPEQLKEEKIDFRDSIIQNRSRLLEPFDGHGEDAMADFISNFREDFMGHFITSQDIQLPVVYTEGDLH